MTARRQLLLAMAAGLLSACAGIKRPAMAYLDGSVGYGAALPWPRDKTLLRVRLLAAAQGDAPPQVLAEQILEQVTLPVSYSLCYDPQAIRPGQQYLVDARLFADGELRMLNRSPHPVFAANAAGPIQLEMLVP